MKTFIFRNMEESYFRKNIEPKLQEIINSLSLACAITTLLLVLVLGYFRGHIFNRVSLRFQGLVAFVDILRHVAYLNLNQPDSSTACIFMGFFLFFINHLYIFFNMIIALNIQLLYFHGIRPNKHIEILLVSGAVVVAGVINAVPFAYDFYGKNHLGQCFFKNNSEHKLLFKRLLMYFVQLTGITYCLIVFILVSLFLLYRRNMIEEQFPNKAILLYGKRVNARQFVIKLYRRMSLYPMSSFVCFLPYITASMYFETYKHHPDWMFFLFRFGIRFTGTLNLIALFFDPHFRMAIQNIREKGLNFFHVSKRELDFEVDLNTTEELKEDDLCLVKFLGQDSIEYNDYIRFI